LDKLIGKAADGDILSAHSNYTTSPQIFYKIKLEKRVARQDVADIERRTYAYSIKFAIVISGICTLINAGPVSGILLPLIEFSDIVKPRNIMVTKIILSVYFTIKINFSYLGLINQS
jgi:hypothetical protein